MTAPASPPDAPAVSLCSRCEKPSALCVCDRIPSLHARTEVLILQHPQEPDKLIGTARLTTLAIDSARLVVGLSWASLAHAVGREVDPRAWAVLYLGSLKKPLTPEQLAQPLVLLDRQGEQLDPKRSKLQGIVVLDGTWSQAKTLWWRNPWMLKLNRLILHPTEPSAYGRLRKEPRRECLSTVESVAEALVGLGEKPEIRPQLRTMFRTLLQRVRDAEAANPRPAPTRPRRGAPRVSRGGGPLD